MSTPVMSPLRWSQFNVESTQETYLLTQGSRRDSQFDVGLFQEDEEEDDVEQRLDTLERAQRKFNRDLEEVIQAIPDMVVWALQVERAARPALDQGAQQPAPGEQLGDAPMRPQLDGRVPALLLDPQRLNT
ncbi:UNVERIFIED_CONTAM: hypothetical protein K2H54_002965 [Gekko kuhli]